MEPYNHTKKPTSHDLAGTLCPHCGKSVITFTPSPNLREVPDGSCFWNCSKCGGLLHENPQGYVFGVLAETVGV